MFKKSSLATAVFFCAIAVMAQDAPPDNSTPPPPPPPRGGMPPCLRMAGVSASEFDQLRSIAQEARAQVQDVCANTSLAPQQKRQQIEEIHSQSHEKMAGIVTPEQRRAFMACRARRGDRRPVEWYERPGGGCGGQRGAQAGNGNTGPDSQPEENGPAGSGPPAKDSAPQNNESAPQKNDSNPPNNNSSPQ